MRSVLAFVAAAAVWAQPASLNVSHDLTTLKIASQNMVPDTTALDSRPLLEAAVAYAQTHSIPLITSDRGSYYFLTGHPFGRFFSFQSLQNLTVDFHGSDLYFALGNWIGLECDGCLNVTFQNFTLDSLQLPFTQVTVASVDTSNHRIAYSATPGWEPATNFNTIRNPFSTAEPLYAFAFRNGSPLRSTSRMSVQRPLDPAYLSIASDGSPWSNPQQLASLQPGDVIVLSARAGGPTLVARNGSNISIKNVAVYFGGGVGVMLSSCVNSTAEQVQVIPRPGTDRLISTNADGISAVQLGQNLAIRRSRVRRTGDDGISPNSQQLAVVTGVPAPNQVSVNRAGYSNFPNQLQVQFIDNKTGFPALTAKIVSQDPPYSPALPGFGFPVTLTLDQNVPALAVNDPMVYADPSFRGAGLVIENNLVEDVLQARGMSLWGLLGGTIQGNVLRNLPWSGISAIEQDSTATWMTGPVANLTIQRNVVEQFSTAFGTAVVSALGGIDVEADDLNFAPVPGTPLQNITVANNFVSTGPYSGIHIANVNGGSASGNTLMNVSTNPTANNPNSAWVPQLRQAVALITTSNIVSTPNTVDTATAPALVSSGVSASDEAIAPNSWAKVKGTHLAPQTDLATTDPLPTSFDGVTLTITDSTGANHSAPLWFISDQQINFLVPPDCALGAAVVTVSSNGVNSGRGGILIDSLAPALFTADGSGSGAALGVALTIHPDGSFATTPLTQPIDLGQTGDSVSLVLFATGIRNRSSLDNVTAFFNGGRVPVQFAGDQGTYYGLDQVNIAIPAQFRGAGPVSLRMVVDGLSTNVATIHIK